MLKNDLAGWETFFSRFYWLLAKGAAIYPSRKRCERILFKLKLNKDDKIIEMGCGAAFFLRSFKNAGFRNLYGLDYSNKILEHLKDTGITPISADVRDLRLKHRSFELVLSDGLLEHFVDPFPVLLGLSDIAKSYLVTIVPRKTLSNKIQNLILRPPEEFNRLDADWVKMHGALDFGKIDRYILGKNCLMIVCSR